MDSTYPKARSFFFASGAIFIAYEALGIKINPEASSKLASIDAKITIERPEFVSTVIFLAMSYFLFRLISEWRNNEKNLEVLSFKIEVVFAFFIFLISIYFQIEIFIPGFINFNYHVTLSSGAMVLSSYYGYILGRGKNIGFYFFLMCSVFSIFIILYLISYFSLLTYVSIFNYFTLDFILYSNLMFFVSSLGFFLIYYSPSKYFNDKNYNECLSFLKDEQGMRILGSIPFSRHRDSRKLGMISQSNPRSDFCENYKFVKTSLVDEINKNSESGFNQNEGALWVFVSSFYNGDGKTTAAINLATTFAQEGKTVLIIDTNLRNPSMHKRLQLDNTKGLTNYMTGQDHVEAITQGCQIPDVYVITAGPMTDHPVENLGSDRLAELKKNIISAFDIVIVDSSSCFVGHSDASLVSRFCDHHVLILREGMKVEELKVNIKFLSFSFNSILINFAKKSIFKFIPLYY